MLTFAFMCVWGPRAALPPVSDARVWPTQEIQRQGSYAFPLSNLIVAVLALGIFLVLLFAHHLHNKSQKGTVVPCLDNTSSEYLEMLLIYSKKLNVRNNSISKQQ